MQYSFFFFFMVAVAFVAAGPIDPPPSKDAAYKTIKSDFNLEPAGAYNFGFETENKIVRDEVGELKTIKNEEGKDENVVVVRGSFSYPGEDGKLLTVTYYADESGFHAEGEHLPVAPLL